MSVRSHPFTRVKCYAGIRYPERPIAFEWQGGWLDVAVIVRQERSPAGLVFWAQTADDRRFRLEWVEATDKWLVETAAESRRSIADE